MSRPLTPAEQALVERYAADWPDPLQPLRAVYPGTYRTAKALGLDDDDIRGAAWLAVAQAARRYDPDRASFATHALWWIRSAVGKEIAARLTAKRSGTTVSGDQVVGGGWARPAPLWDVLGVSAPAGPDPAAAERAAAVRRVLQTVPEPDRAAAELMFGLADGVPRNMAEVGLILGVSRERVRQRVERVKARLRVPLQLAGHGLTGAGR